MTNYFYLTIHDKNINQKLVLDSFIDIDGKNLNVYVGDTKNFHNLDSCVIISIRKDEIRAGLTSVKYRPVCIVNGKMEEGMNGTHIMLKGVLRFVVELFPDIQIIEIYDVAEKENVYITPKKLLLGQPGWYEEKFGAIPTDETKVIIKDWLPNQKKYIDHKTISKLTWGTEEDLQEHFYKLIGTTWYITREIIEKYPLDIEVKYITIDDKKQTGGKNIIKWIKNVEQILSHQIRLIKKKVII
jgi:hypothetical protein